MSELSVKQGASKGQPSPPILGGSVNSRDDCDYGQCRFDEIECKDAGIEQLRHALTGLLDWAKRYRSGDPSLDPEEFYIESEYAAKVLANTAKAKD